MEIYLFQESCIKIIWHANIWSSILQKWRGSNLYQVMCNVFHLKLIRFLTANGIKSKKNT